MAFWGPLLGGLATGLVGGLLNWESTKDTNETNVKLWRQQADYNQPINQVRRLEAAGLNPQLAYGQVAESRMGTPPTMQAPQVGDSAMSALHNYQQIVNMQEQNKQIRANNERIATETALSKEQLRYLKWENEKLRERGQLRSDPALIKSVRSGLDTLGEYSVGVLKRATDPVGRALNYSKTIPDRVGSFIKDRLNRKGVPLRERR